MSNLCLNLVRDILFCPNNFENFENLFYFVKYSKLINILIEFQSKQDFSTIKHVLVNIFNSKLM